MATTARRGSRRGTTTEEARPSRRGRSSESPRGRRGRAAEAEEEVEDDEDEDEAPRARRSSRRGASSDGGSRRSRRGASTSDDDGGAPKRASGRRGWGKVEEQREITKGTSSDYIPQDVIWKPHEDFTLVKFLEDEPFVSYALHWFKSKPKGRAGWECIAPLPYDDSDEGVEKYGEVGDCPLCESFDNKPRMNVEFNIAVFDEEADRWEYRVLRAGVTLAEQLQSLNESRHGPLSKHYWEMMATGSAGNYSPNAQVVKDGDLIEDWNLEPLTEDDIADLMEDAYDEDIVSFPTYDKLAEIADEMIA